MADVSRGPVSTMPGSVSSTDQVCDLHPNRRAAKRVQGETDSFGCEYIDMCQECFDKYLEERNKPDLGVCDWCKNRDALFPRRDYEEGMSGRIYYVCKPCIKGQQKRLIEELENSHFYD